MKTKVTQTFTVLKIFNPVTEKVETIRLLGKILTRDLKQTLETLGYPANSSVVVKMYERETFTVDSEKLYQLKQDLTNQTQKD